MLTPEILAKLTTEQKELAEKWEQEQKVREEILNAHDRGELTFKEAMDKLAATVDGFCEHDRSIWSPCAACHELEMILYPDQFDEDGNRIDEWV